MNRILSNETLEMENVISYRSVITQQGLTEVMNNIGKFVQSKNLKLNGCITTTTYAINSDGTMDVEVLVPVDREVDVPDGYIFKKKILLTNAIKLRHEGNPNVLQSSVDKLTDYISENRLTPITSMYNVTIKRAKSTEELENIIIDLYIGISPNIL